MAEQNVYPTYPEWKTVRIIGAGSYGTVYEIEQDVIGYKEKAALKVISIPQKDSDIEELYDSGYDEASVTATFKSHMESIVNEYSLMRKMYGAANVVNCDDFRIVQHDDNIGWDVYIKMELLTPLTKALPKEIPEKQVIQIAKDMCRALELCDKHGIIHRDIKPQNIFVSKNGDYKLGDFGIAKTIEKTSGGTMIGTPKFMAPEVYNNQPYNKTADIYSLGLVLYWLLNERRQPFMPLPPAPAIATQEAASREKRFRGALLPAPAHGSKELQRIVLKACAFDPKDRYHAAKEMSADLAALPNDLTCEYCGAIITPKTAICKKCGNETDITVGMFDQICPHCGCVTSKKNRICSECGAPIISDGDSAKIVKRIVIGAIGAVLLIVVGIALHAIISKWQQVDVSTAKIAGADYLVNETAEPLNPSTIESVVDESVDTTIGDNTETEVIGYQEVEGAEELTAEEETQTESETTEVKVPGVWDLTNDSVVAPYPDCWLPAYVTRIVTPQVDTSIYLRAVPNPDADHYTTIPAGEIVTEMARQNSMSLVRTMKGQTGWVRSDRISGGNAPEAIPDESEYADADKTKPGVWDMINEYITLPDEDSWLPDYERAVVVPQTLDCIYLRAEPTYDAGHFETIPAGEIVTVLARQYGMSLIRTDYGSLGWVRSDRISVIS